ncbi:NACHT LRR and PYD domains-containing protein 12 [Dissostichus eleginoides]|uniref:NACHT LRR and PYD domains-containing protein 12 n=1 Tax=Dissostichus eleginoides TaxID=100907 RepID=A0AAD9CBH9_DISEL|nr:NACHT LRR and PYD domains-containing protein 12 [Dissostichus eleginoides]
MMRILDIFSPYRTGVKRGWHVRKYRDNKTHSMLGTLLISNLLCNIWKKPPKEKLMREASPPGKSTLKTDDTVVIYASVNTSARGQQPERDPTDYKAICIIYAELPTSRRMASPLKLM